MNIVVRVDASTEIGTGHVMRCLTLAKELLEKEFIVQFICKQHVGNLISFIMYQGFQVKILQGGDECLDYNRSGLYAGWLGCSQKKDASDVIKLLDGHGSLPECLIVDHYSLDSEWESSVRPYVKNIMVIDDLANREHNCELLLDQNYFKQDSRYQGLVPEHCIKLLGPKYALLRKEFTTFPVEKISSNETIQRILVFFGGSDYANMTEKVLNALALINRVDIAIDIVIGANNKNIERLKKIAISIPVCELHKQVDNMVELINNADLFIGAGGITVWERCFLGVPTLAISVAENQLPILRDLGDDGYILFLGDAKDIEIDIIVHHIQCLLHNPFLIKYLIQRSKSLVDGGGGQRVLSHILNLAR